MKAKNVTGIIAGCAAMVASGSVLANDDCADAIPVSLGDVVAGSTSAATFDDVGFCGTGNTAPGVWYTMTGNGDLVQLSTCNNADYDTKISVFSGSCGALTCVTGQDDAAGCAGFTTELTFGAGCNVDYYILVHGFGSATGNFTLSITDVGDVACGPANDDVCNAQPVAMNSVTPFDNTGATAAPGEVSPGPGTGPGSSCNATDGWCNFETAVQNSVWFTFIAPDCGGVEIAANSEDYQLAVWQVGFCSNFATFTEIAANDDSGPGFAPLLELCDLTPGATYYIQVDGFAGTSAPGTLEVSEFACTDCNANGIDDDCEILFGLAYDCNCNGIPDECDLLNPLMDLNNDGFIDSCTACAGDTNCDGIVNGIDAMNVFFNLGSPGPFADVNQDGIVSFLDYYIVIWNYGSFCN